MNFLKKYRDNLLLIVVSGIILLVYNYVNDNKKLERYWVKQSKVVYEGINYSIVILKLSMAFNLKFILVDLITYLKLLVA